jgi:dolichyl-phosphate-mannose-protein mannosyltransferase/glycosyl transferase family 22 (putative mannosyltransferase)
MSRTRNDLVRDLFTSVTEAEAELSIVEREPVPPAPDRLKRWTAGKLATGTSLTVIVAVGTYLRLYGLGRVGFNSDEAVYAGQAASIANVKEFTPFFPIYRAHPLLFQALLSIPYHFAVSDFAARLVAVVFGLATVALAYSLGRAMYGGRAGLAAAAILAIMPYSVVTSRQALLDTTETFFAALVLYALVRYALTSNRFWMYAAGAALGLTFLSKETGIVLAASVIFFLALSPDVRLRSRDLLGGLAVLVGMTLVYPLSIAVGGASTTGKSFFVWQLLRRPNHDLFFYFSTALPAMGLLVLVVALGGLVLLWRDRSWRETLLLAWILVPLMFFTIWPVKGYQYLLPIAPAVALLAARALSRLPIRRSASVVKVVASVMLILVLGGSLLVASWTRIASSSSTALLAGTGGVPGGRESGEWLRANVPADARLLALGPSMANILEFYGNRKAWGLSVSTNSLHRNPVYQPLANPDSAIRRGDVQYLVWDSYSADRAPSFAARLLRYVARFHGRVVHTESVKHGNKMQPVIVIYAVRP